MAASCCVYSIYLLQMLASVPWSAALTDSLAAFMQNGNSTKTVQAVHIWSVSYQVGNTDLGNSAARLYLLNDNVYFNLENGVISVGEPQYFLTAAKSGGVSLTTPPGSVFQISPTVRLSLHIDPS